MNRVITSTRIAKSLIRMGFVIVDIKAHRDEPKRTVFIFKETDALNQVIEELKSKDTNYRGDETNEENTNNSTTIFK